MKSLFKTVSLAALLATTSGSLRAAPFDSGSDGSDGPLVFAPHMGDVVFDPDNFDPALDSDRDGIYHFTTITVGQGTQVRLGADVLGHKPLIWLASDDVIIEGVLNLGASGNNLEIPGVGGFYGGKEDGILKGQGPGGSPEASPPYEPSENHITPYLIPLIGGSGKGLDINNGSEVTILVECTGIPLGSNIEVMGWNDTVGEVFAVTALLTGTLEASEATCTMVIPSGNTTFMARAVLAP
ncbi:MAG: hypothetical protein GVY36_16855 [Verrucomicrobia bacterium]|jgi:hypothetical protein|nr:hypothetical protein [Verrucomicrobiota bacterium]